MSESDQQFADGLIDATDVAILEQVATMYDQIDPMPTGLVDRLRFAITLDALNAEVAELQELSGVGAARTEASEQATSLTFSSGSLSAMVNTSASESGQVRVDGWIVPSGVYTVEIKQTDEVRQVETDADGRFALAELPHGRTQFLFRRADGLTPPVVTPVVEL